MNMKKRILCCLLILSMVIAMTPAFVTANAATVDTLAEPKAVEYRFNGHSVTDRGSFRQILGDWTLATFTDAPAVITAGTAGVGLSYCGELGDAWYARVTIALKDSDEAGVILGGDDGLYITLKTVSGALNLIVAHEEQILLDKAVGNHTGNITVLLDNTSSAKELKLHLYAGENWLGGWALQNLPQSATSILGAVDRISFRATTAGTAFTDIAVNAMIYKYFDDPEAALAKVEAMVKAEVEGSIVYADNGVPMYTPDGVKNYNALWTRDFNYMLEYAGDYIPLENAIACIEYLLENVHEGDCWLPDRVYANGAVNYAAGDMAYNRRNLDNNSFIVISMDCVLKRMDEEAGKALLSKWETTLMTALASIPKADNGLVYNDPQNPHSPYGFTDCICKTGMLMKESLLLWRAYTIMAKWQEAYGMDGSVAAAGAAKIEDALLKTFLNEDGMLDAATVDCHQTDIWGSCYAISIGFPMDESVKKGIADYLAANYDALVQMGQVRHTAPGTYWDRLLGMVYEGEYQNGAYWATPTGWLVDALVKYYPDLARITIQDIVTYYEELGIYECVNGDYKKLNHYGASASNILPAARMLLTVSADMTDLAIDGDREAVVGADKVYTAVITPADVKLRSCVWTLDGQEVGTGTQLPLHFDTAGSYTLNCTAEDINGNVKTAQITITVTQPVYAPITITAGAITGKAGDVVTVCYRVNEGAALVSADLEIVYDPAVLAPEGERSGVAAGEDWHGVLSGGTAGEGRIRVCMATSVGAEGEIMKVTFRLLQDVTEATYAMPENAVVHVDYQDDTGLHNVAVTTAKEIVQKPEDPAPSPDTGDAGIAMAVATAITTMSSAVFLIKKKEN